MKQQDGRSFVFIKYWPIVAAICIGLTGFGIFRLVKSNPETDSMTTQTTSIIRTGDIRLTAIGSGTLISSAEVELGFKNGGVVEEILVETGDEVSEGELLARLDDDDLEVQLEIAEQNLRELTSDAAVAAAALELAEAQKALLSAESELSFLLSPYVFKAELRLQGAQDKLQAAQKDAELNPSEEADHRVMNAQEVVDNAVLSLALNWVTYHEEYVPGFFNFRWRDQYGFWHDYYDPPSETEVDVVWAELATAEARVEEAEAYLAVLTEGVVSENASGSQLTELDNTGEEVVDAQENLEASRLVAPSSGVIIDIDMQILDHVGTGSVLTIAQLEPPTLEVSFDERDWRLVKEGYSVEVIFDAFPEKTYSGQIVFVDPSLLTTQNSTTVNALVELDIANTGWANLPLGSATSVEVIAGEVTNALLLPVEALQEQQGNTGSVLLMENGEVTQQEVELGLRDVIYVEVTSGLSAGDVVVIGNLEY